MLSGLLEDVHYKVSVWNRWGADSAVVDFSSLFKAWFFAYLQPRSKISVVTLLGNCVANSFTVSLSLSLDPKISKASSVLFARSYHTYITNKYISR